LSRRVLSSPDSPDAVLAGYISNALSGTLPTEVENKARLHLLDTLAAILSGRFLPAGEFGYRYAEGHVTCGAATLFGDTRAVGAELAAFANAMAAHADETDDSHLAGRFHPGCGVVPAAMAMAQAKNRSGAELLAAIALGYDVGARSTMALGFSSPRTTKISTHAFGALFGASAAAGALAGLSAAEAESLLSFTVQQASGLSYWNRDPDHVEKSFDFGARAARNGIFAAHLAEAGMTSPDHPLTGVNSYLAAYAENARPDVLVDGLGTRYAIMDASIKKWSVGSPMQSMLDAVVEVFEGKPTAVEEIEDLELRLPSNRVHVVDDRHMPAVCAQHLAALCALRGTVGFADSHDVELMSDPQILALRQKIHLVPDHDLAEARPERQAIVTVRLSNGEVRSHHAKVVRGTPDDPMSAQEVADKVSDILSNILPDGGKKLIALCLDEPFTLADLAEASRIDGSKIRKTA
jgi:2-methylcitrate dehydratase PrpD